MDDRKSETTVADILQAFKGCENAGEEIWLFESLAERDEPPIDAFVEILKNIKLETVLALAIQAFGKIRNDEVKARLKESDVLLELLSDRAKFGSSDLIKWSAATVIERIGFDFIAVSRYLTEEPEAIVQRIVQSKVRLLADVDKSGHSIAEHNGYDSLIRFWVYGATYELRSATVSQFDGNAAVVVKAVVKAQDVWGIKQTNFLFLALENSHEIQLQDAVQKVYENQLFERECQLLASELLQQRQSSTNIKILVSNQVRCLQSNIVLIRQNAASILLSLDDKILETFEADTKNPRLKILAKAICDCENSFSKKGSFNDELTYEDVSAIICNLKNAIKLVSRAGVYLFFNQILEHLSKQIIEYILLIGNNKDINRGRILKRWRTLKQLRDTKRELEEIERENKELNKAITKAILIMTTLVLAASFLLLTETGRSILGWIEMIVILAILGICGAGANDEDKDKDNKSS